METKHISGAETSKMIKQTLKQAFPSVKFSVRYKSYSGGSSISIHWTDGPTTKQVDAITNRFERCGFDGMQDLKTYLDPCELNGELVTFGADYISCSRSESFDALKRAALEVSFECQLPLLEIERPDYSKSFYHSPSVKGGNYMTNWRFRSEWISESQNGFAFDSHNSAPFTTHAELIYQYARTIDFSTPAPVKTPTRVTQDFIDMKVEGMVS